MKKERMSDAVDVTLGLLLSWFFFGCAYILSLIKGMTFDNICQGFFAVVACIAFIRTLNKQ